MSMIAPAPAQRVGRRPTSVPLYTEVRLSGAAVERPGPGQQPALPSGRSRGRPARTASPGPCAGEPEIFGIEVPRGVEFCRRLDAGRQLPLPPAGARRLGRQRAGHDGGHHLARRPAVHPANRAAPRPGARTGQAAAADLGLRNRTADLPGAGGVRRRRPVSERRRHGHRRLRLVVSGGPQAPDFERFATTTMSTLQFEADRYRPGDELEVRLDYQDRQRRTGDSACDLNADQCASPIGQHLFPAGELAGEVPMRWAALSLVALLAAACSGSVASKDSGRSGNNNDPGGRPGSPANPGGSERRPRIGQQQPPDQRDVPGRHPAVHPPGRRRWPGRQRRRARATGRDGPLSGQRHAAGPTAVAGPAVRAHRAAAPAGPGQRLDGAGDPGWQWQVVLEQTSNVEPVKVSPAGDVVEIPLRSPGIYTITASAGPDCASASVSASARLPSDRVVSYWVRVTPPRATELPTQEAMIADRWHQRPAQGHRARPRRPHQPSTPNTPKRTPEPSARSSGSARPSPACASRATTWRGAFKADLDPRLVYDVLIVPEGSEAPALIRGSSSAQLRAEPFMFDPGLLVSGGIFSRATGMPAGSPDAPVNGARVFMRAGELPSTIGTSDAAGRFELRARPGNFQISVLPAAGSGLPEARLPVGDYVPGHRPQLPADLLSPRHRCPGAAGGRQRRAALRRSPGAPGRRARQPGPDRQLHHRRPAGRGPGSPARRGDGRRHRRRPLRPAAGR